VASSTLDSWCTPRPVLDAIAEFNHGKQIALDPCSNHNSIVGARVEWYGPPHGTNGLAIPWLVDGLIYVNPPYSAKHIWMSKCSNESRDRKHEIFSLLPADTDTEWFHRFAVTATSMCFWSGRLVFRGDRKYPARFASLVTYWGHRKDRFRKLIGQHGYVP